MRCPILAMMTLLLLTVPVLADSLNTSHLIDTDGPRDGVQSLALRELWRAGGEDEDVMFGRITDLGRHVDGNLYVLDNQLCQVVVISPEGEVLRYLSREGDGPGELRQPTGLVFLSDEVVGVGLGFPAKLATMSLDGTPLETYFPVGAPAEGNVAVMITMQFVDGVLVASGGSINFAPDGNSRTRRFLSVGDATCADFTHILEAYTPIDPTGRVFVEADNYYIDRGWVLGPGGRIYAAMKRDAYEISEFDTSGQLQHVFGRQYEPRLRTKAEKDRITPLINPGTNVRDEWKIEDHDPCITRLMIDPDGGDIWVLTPHGHEDQPDGVLETWDVFSPEGAYLRQVTVPLGDEIDEGTCWLVGDGQMVVVRGTGSVFNAGPAEEVTEIEPLEIICYEIE